MRKLLFTAVSLALCSGVQAQALTSTQSAAISAISTSNLFDSSEGSTPTTQAITRSLSFNKFDSNTGVLTGISSTLSYTGGSLALSASGTRIASGPSFSSQGSVTASSNLTGLSAFGAINETLSNSCTNTSTCFPNGTGLNLSQTTSLNKTDSTWLAPTATVSAASLNSYVGAGTVASTLTTTASVNQIEQTNISSPRANLALTNLAGSQSLTYSYLKHANASFASAADTNTLSLSNLTAAGSGFSVFNFGDTHSTKLDSVSVQCITGNCSAFNLTFASFQDLAAGVAKTGTAALATNVVGNYSARYTLTFSDDTAIGATSTQLQNSLTLDVAGNVAAVPEPSSWALLSIGLVGLAFCRRKKQ